MKLDPHLVAGTYIQSPILTKTCLWKILLHGQTNYYVPWVNFQHIYLVCGCTNNTPYGILLSPRSTSRTYNIKYHVQVYIRYILFMIKMWVTETLFIVFGIIHESKNIPGIVESMELHFQYELFYNTTNSHSKLRYQPITIQKKIKIYYIETKGGAWDWERQLPPRPPKS